MRVGYGKLGRVIEMDPKNWGESGGDNEPADLLLTLARKHPEVTWVVVGKNSGWTPPLPNIENPWQEWHPLLKGIPSAHHFEQLRVYDRVTGPTFEGLDGIVLWLGQHGTSNTPVPKIADRSILTTPQISFMGYCSFLIRGVNRWRDIDPINREEVWLLSDVRNYLKAHDFKWPRRHPILAQYSLVRKEWVERYGDPEVPEHYGFSDVSAGRNVAMIDGKWRSVDAYIPSGLELVGVHPDKVGDFVPWEDREKFGIIINENRNYGYRTELTRLYAMQKFVVPVEPSFIHGTWSQPSLDALGFDIKPLKYGTVYDKLSTAKSTFTTPASGSGWATAKPWESFSAGTICFFHPNYDDQDVIIKQMSPDLAKWLRVMSPSDLAKRVEAVNNDKATYEWLRDQQFAVLNRALEDQQAIRLIEERLGL